MKYPHLADLASGDVIRFRIKGTDETCEVNVKRVTEYADFETLLDNEGPANVNPTVSREQQLADIRAIYPPEKETLGTLAIEIARTSRLRILNDTPMRRHSPGSCTPLKCCFAR